VKPPNSEAAPIGPPPQGGMYPSLAPTGSKFPRTDRMTVTGRITVERDDPERFGGCVLLSEEAARRGGERLELHLRLDRDDPMPVANDEVDLAPVFRPPMINRLAEFLADREVLDLVDEDEGTLLDPRRQHPLLREMVEERRITPMG